MSIVVLFSGGQDSCTVLGMAVKKIGAMNVYPISVDYGQRHEVELEQAYNFCMALGLREPKIVDMIEPFKGAASALINDGPIDAAHAYDVDLPASFVPNRNATLLTLAHGYAQKIGATEVWAGMCQTDYSGYPDCRLPFIQALETALNLGSPEAINIRFVTPLMHLTKAETFEKAEYADLLNEVIEHSHTCYEGERDKRHPWGYGCGECPACKLRAKGWSEFVEGNQRV